MPPPDSTEPTLRDNPVASRYEVWADGQLAGVTEYRLHADHITFVHTEIEPPFEGAGLGSRLARFALGDARSRGLMIAPQCPFIARYIRGHRDEYLDSVVPAWRGRLAEAAPEVE